MKTKETYIKELSVLDGIKKCVLRYANSVSTKDKDELNSEWYKEYIKYLNNKEQKIMKKIKEKI